MKLALRQVVAETATLSVVVLATFWFAPQLAVAYPDWHPLVHYAIPTVGAALLVALLKTFVFARAHVSVEWTRKGESSPLRELDAEVKRESKFGLHEYVATVEFQRAYGLGWVALQVGTRTGVWIRAEGVHAQLRSTRMWQDGPDNESRARSGPRCSAELRLMPPVPVAETVWCAGQFRFDGLTERTSSPRRARLRHTAVGTSAVSKLCAKLISVDSKATAIVERWS